MSFSVCILIVVCVKKSFFVSFSFFSTSLYILLHFLSFFALVSYQLIYDF